MRLLPHFTAFQLVEVELPVVVPAKFHVGGIHRHPILVDAPMLTVVAGSAVPCVIAEEARITCVQVNHHPLTSAPQIEHAPVLQ